jgi:hypothetical protein
VRLLFSEMLWWVSVVRIAVTEICCDEEKWRSEGLRIDLLGG